MRFLILFGAGALAVLLILRLLNLQLRRRSDNRSTTSDGSGPIIEGSVVPPSPKVSDDSKGKGQDSNNRSGAHGGPSSDSGGSDGGGDGGGGGD